QLVVDALITLTGFRASNNNSGLIRCDGTYRLPVAGGLDSAMRLTFRGSGLSMDDSLRSSLPPSSQVVWDALSPSGVLDDATVVITQAGSGQPLGLDLLATQFKVDQVTNRSLSIRPPSIPYRMDIAGGRVRYDGDRVTITDVWARNDASLITANGTCVPRPDGRWLLSLDVLNGSRLHPDAELIAAVPDAMGDAMRQLQLRGPVGLRGQTQVVLPDDQFPDPEVDWDLVLQLEGNRIGDVGPVHSVRGEISVRGHHDVRRLSAMGEARIDSLHMNQQHLWAIRGPFRIENDLLLLGGSSRIPGTVSSTAGVIPDPIRGRVFGGVAEMDGEVRLASGDFDIGVAIRDGQVPVLLADWGHGKAGLTGTFQTQARFEGSLSASHLLKGAGSAQLTNANLYQLPLLVQVLNQLRITPTEQVAFTDGDVEFTLLDDQFNFSQLKLWGDLVALDGGGTMNRRQELDLTFNTKVSPQNTFSKLLNPLNDSHYTLWTIDVQGPLDSPEVNRRALDGVGKTLGRFIPNLGWNRGAEANPSSGSFFQR
ncbi:MAG: hypothetical protein AAGA03_12250, partial [Planctomycetota bacterium]